MPTFLSQVLVSVFDKALWVGSKPDLTSQFRHKHRNQGIYRDSGHNLGFPACIANIFLVQATIQSETYIEQDLMPLD